MALITFEDVNLAYDGEQVAHDISFSVRSGEYWCIVGENGSGKTSLMKALLGLIDCASGKIRMGDGLTPNEIGYLPQQSAIQKDFPASVYEVVLSGTITRRGLKPFYGKEERQLAREKMELLGIESLSKRCYQELSGGQQQRVLLARALCATRKLLVLDEPTAGLDPVVTQDFYRLVSKVHREGLTILMVTHDLRQALSDATHILHLSCHPLYLGPVSEYSVSEIGRRYLKEVRL